MKTSSMFARAVFVVAITYCFMGVYAPPVQCYDTQPDNENATMIRCDDCKEESPMPGKYCVSDPHHPQRDHGFVLTGTCEIPSEIGHSEIRSYRCVGTTKNTSEYIDCGTSDDTCAVCENEKPCKYKPNRSGKISSRYVTYGICNSAKKCVIDCGKNGDYSCPACEEHVNAACKYKDSSDIEKESTCNSYTDSPWGRCKRTVYCTLDSGKCDACRGYGVETACELKNEIGHCHSDKTGYCIF